MFESLFSPIRIGKMEIKNRFVMPPMGTCFANPDATVSDQMINYYATRAKGGFGLITIEVTSVAPLGGAIKTEAGLWDDKFIPGYKKLIGKCHKYGAKVSVQLHHSGRQTKSAVINAQPEAPSAVPCPLCHDMPRELTTKEVYRHVQNYIDAAKRAVAAGADAVEVHAAHGYEISQFISLYSNKRTDEFGGTFLNRMRFLDLIIKGIREQVDNSLPIILRISGEEKVVGGRTIDETRVICRYVERLGVNAIHVSAGVYGSSGYIWAPTETRPGFIVYMAEQVKKSVKIPVITVGRFTDPFMAEDVILTGKADMVSFGRQSIADPYFPNKVAGGNLEEIAPCIACHQGCASNIFVGEGMTCLVNPFCGKEQTRLIEKTKNPKKVMIVGGGPAGLEAAWIAARRGHTVSLYEKESVLGGQFRIGAIPPGKGDLTMVIAYYNTLCKKYGVNVVMETEVTAELVKKESPDVVILSTGGVPLVPHIDGIDNPALVQAVDILLGKAVPGSKVLIIGGGQVGVETADYLGQYGHDLTIIEMKHEIMEDTHYVHKEALDKRLKEYGTKVITDAKVEQFIDGKGVMYEKDGAVITLDGFDTVILALGAKAYNPLEEKLKDMVAEVHVIGDAVKARNAKMATEEASVVAVSI